jgi:hypothetical protein
MPLVVLTVVVVVFVDPSVLLLPEPPPASQDQDAKYSPRSLKPFAPVPREKPSLSKLVKLFVSVVSDDVPLGSTYLVAPLAELNNL